MVFCEGLCIAIEILFFLNYLAFLVKSEMLLQLCEIFVPANSLNFVSFVKGKIIFLLCFYFLGLILTYYYFPSTFFLLYSMVTQLHIHVEILFSRMIMLHHKWLSD